MITFESHRFNGAPCPVVKREMTPGQAFFFLAAHELGFGGSVRDVVRGHPESSVEVVTRVFACTDTDTFSGPTEEMALLLDLVDQYVCVRHVLREPLTKRTTAKVMSMQGVGKPLLLATIGPMLFIGPIIRPVVFAVLGLTDPDDYRKNHDLPLEEFVTMAQLARECGISITTVRQTLN